MTTPLELLRLRLATGPKSGTQMAREMGLSQPTVSRALAAMGQEVLQIGAKKNSRYVLRDSSRGFADVPVFQVDSQGQLQPFGNLTPVRPDGFVFTPTDGPQVHSDGVPWWLLDMLPQGYLGRAYAARHAASLGLPSALNTWSDSHAIRALLAHGHDMVGHLLLGNLARDTFIALPEPSAVANDNKPATYAALALAASQGDTPGSSAGGEQPKFTAYAQTTGGASHVLVKFTEPLESPVSQRWRDLLLAEHLALSCLQSVGVAAASSAVLNHQGQRFLELARFDRRGAMGRHAVVSLRALDAEFVGDAHQPWPVIVQTLATLGVVTREAAERTELLWAFGMLMGNTDMHAGNLSFVCDSGRPFHLAPAYDMCPMAFAPSSSGKLNNAAPPLNLHACVRNDHWRQALLMANQYLKSLRSNPEFSPDFAVCIAALAGHLDAAKLQIQRLA
jgi:hypothetical protein